MGRRWALEEMMERLDNCDLYFVYVFQFNLYVF